MAKIKDLKFEVAGEKFSIAVNCGVSGQFTTTLPSNVASALRLNSKLSAPSLSELEKIFFGAINRYKVAETKQNLFILIRYEACGFYTEKKDGSVLFGTNDRRYYMNRFHNETDAIGFEFQVAIEEVVDGVSNWFKAKAGRDFPRWEEEKTNNPDKYYKDGTFYNTDKWKKIPFSEKAVETLTIGRERIRQISEMLFNFIELDEKAIEQKLTNQKLLS